MRGGGWRSPLFPRAELRSTAARSAPIRSRLQTDGTCSPQCTRALGSCWSRGRSTSPLMRRNRRKDFRFEITSACVLGRMWPNVERKSVRWRARIAATLSTPPTTRYERKCSTCRRRFRIVRCAVPRCFEQNASYSSRRVPSARGNDGGVLVVRRRRKSPEAANSTMIRMATRVWREFPRSGRRSRAGGSPRARRNFSLMEASRRRPPTLRTNSENAVHVRRYHPRVRLA